MRRLIVKRHSTGLVWFLNILSDNGDSKLIEEVCHPTAQAMSDWLTKYHPGEKIQWLLYPMK